MNALVDTNILVRLSDAGHPMQPALMEAHGLTHLLTINTGDFARFPGIICVEPVHVR